MSVESVLKKECYVTAEPSTAHDDPQADDPAVRVDTVSARTILSLALPALGVLAATPLYMLLDTAVVGRLGQTELAALGAAVTLFSVVTTQLTFLSYGTTARSARMYGAGNRDKAVAEGVQATWVALAVGLMLAAIMWLGSPWFTIWLSGNAHVAAEATSWLRMTSVAIPLLLITMAGNGWMRGVQNTRAPLWFTLAGVLPSAALVPVLVHRFGLMGSAWANVTGLAITSSCFIIALMREHQGSWAVRIEVIKKQLVLGRDLIVRSLSFQVAFLSAASVAARFGEASLAAHQVMMQLWNFLTLVLDSLAIAAQALTGAALGHGSVRRAHRVGRLVTLYSTAIAAVLAVAFALGAHTLPRLFSNSQLVLETMSTPWWILVAMIVAGGVVFALDGVLLGAADASFLRTATILAVVLGFLPGVWLALLLGTGLTGVWCGLLAFVILRMVAVVWRFRSLRWAR